MAIVKYRRAKAGFLTLRLKRRLNQCVASLMAIEKQIARLPAQNPANEIRAINQQIETLRNAEQILRRAGDEAGHKRVYEKRGCGQTRRWRMTDRGRHPRPPSFMMKRRHVAASACRAEVQRLTRRIELLKKLFPRPKKGRYPEHHRGYKAMCLANLLIEETGQPHWEIVGAMLARHFPKFCPPSDPEELGRWANTLARRYQRLAPHLYQQEEFAREAKLLDT